VRSRLPDTNIISRLLRHDHTVHANLQRIVGAGSDVILSPVVEYESRRGFLRKQATAMEARFERLTGQFVYRAFDRSVWVRASAFWAALRTQGMPLPDADILIAAHAFELDSVLVTNNERHFAPFVAMGLQIEDWTK